MATDGLAGDSNASPSAVAGWRVIASRCTTAASTTGATLATTPLASAPSHELAPTEWLAPLPAIDTPIRPSASRRAYLVACSVCSPNNQNSVAASAPASTTSAKIAASGGR